MEKKTQRLEGKNLSFVGRRTLIKAVEQTIPTYVMSCFLIPKSIYEELECHIYNFWWGSK